MGTLNSYGYIFHGPGNSAELCQNFRISRGGGVEPPNPPRYATVHKPITTNDCFLHYLNTNLQFADQSERFNKKGLGVLSFSVANLSIMEVHTKFGNNGRNLIF
jgi:hypothetical protein